MSKGHVQRPITDYDRWESEYDRIFGEKRGTANAVEILHRRFIGDDAKRHASLEEERLNVHSTQQKGRQ